MKMKKCKDCGRALLENEKKCPHCAKKGAETAGRLVQVGGGLLASAFAVFVAKNKDAILKAGRDLVEKNKEKILKTCGDLIDKNKDKALKACSDGIQKMLSLLFKK
jgi:reverse gyrase